MKQMFEQVIVVRSKTYLETLIERFNSKAQAKFYLERSGREFSNIEREHEIYHSSLKELKNKLQLAEKYKIIDRAFLPSYIFTKKDLIIGFGQDGLIANIAKYVNGQPIVGLNPNPEIFDGILLPFNKINETGFKRLIDGNFQSRKVVMAKATFNDGQELLAFNDFFIGPKSHTSARYKINFKDKSESQSSSGIIICTGIGSTGWMSSINNMVSGISGNNCVLSAKPEKEKLIFAVREPFNSKTSASNICFGEITNSSPLRIDSNMVENGVVFSDGIESDFVPFNIGSSVELSIAKQKANLVLDTVN